LPKRIALIRPRPDHRPRAVTDRARRAQLVGSDVVNRAGGNAAVDGVVDHRHRQIAQPHIVAIGGPVFADQLAGLVVGITLGDRLREAGDLADALAQGVVGISTHGLPVELGRRQPIAAVVAEAIAVAAHDAGEGVAIGVAAAGGVADARELVGAGGIGVGSAPGYLVGRRLAQAVAGLV